MSWEEVAVVAHFADMLQIGARNMQNFTLLRAASRSGKPILLKRGAGATIEEWLMAAEYILAEGNPNVVLCERGIRTFERATRHTLDLNAVAMVRERTHLPVVVDPSHAAGVRSLVKPLSMASLAAGACGLIVEVHPDPAQAMSDGAQSLDVPMFVELAGLVHPECAERGPGSQLRLSAVDIRRGRERPTACSRSSLPFLRASTDPRSLPSLDDPRRPGTAAAGSWRRSLMR